MHRFGVAGSAARLYGALVSGIIPTPRCDGDCNASVAAEGDRTAVQRGGMRFAAPVGAPPPWTACAAPGGALRGDPTLPIGMMAVRRS